ncbi:error-prone DNA polymerase [Plastoroseomonas hellenica]|uniref:error-prone DNA polymerase n=1 Tax=Plastoroseomonas hellenica TaxID=2687306 RepID=UPI0034627DE5
MGSGEGSALPGADRRYLALHLPDLATDRLRRTMDLPADRPLAVWATEGPRRVLVAVDPVAARAGLAVGQSLADAQAIAPDLLLQPEEPGAAARVLRDLALWARRYTPLAAEDAPDGVMLDITGCDHLWGGEAALLRDALARLRRAGFAARGAVAGAAATAGALARARSDQPVVVSGEEVAAVGPLPIGLALRLGAEDLAPLVRLGLRRVRDLLALLRAPLARRFGQDLLDRLDAVTGARRQAIRPLQPPPELAVALEPMEPVIARAGIDAVLDRLLDGLCAKLLRAGVGVRRLALLAWRVDGDVQEVVIGTGQPSRAPAHLRRLFRDKLERLAPGLGFERLALEARATDPMPAGAQAVMRIAGRRDESAAMALAQLLDRLGQRVEVRRVAPVASHWPEHMVASLGAQAVPPAMPAGWGGLWAPVLLRRRPEPVEVVALLPDGPPALLCWRGVAHRVAQVQGPRRLEPEWWRMGTLPARRDYYRLELASGARLWVYREGSLERARWLLHGMAAPSCIGVKQIQGASTRGVHESSTGLNWREPIHLGFAELAARSNFTFLDGASHPHELVKRAKRLGYAGIGICDTNSLSGVVRGHVAAKADPTDADDRSIPYRVGCRLLLLDGSEWLVWPTNRENYGRLTALLSAGRMREKAPKGECHIDRTAMFAVADGWVLAVIPPADPDEAFAAGLREAAAALRGRLAMPLLLAAACTYRGDDQARLDLLASMAAQAGAELLATGDVRYHDPARRRLADVVTAIRLHTTVDALGHHAEPNAERHLKPPAEVARLFARYPEALANTIRVLDATEGFKLEDLQYEYPDEILEEGYTAQETLERRVAEALETRWVGGAPADVRKRVAQELQLIRKLGYAPYFLTVQEIVRFAESKGILCQGRGSAANSAVCYALGVTAADPTKHDLLFERFISASRGEPPDIDIDFEHERREEVIQHLYEKYGRHRAAICATLICYRSRSAIREVGKAMGLTEDVTARLAKASWGPKGDRDPGEIAAEEGLDASDPRLALAMQFAAELIGFPRHTATHVGGFVITRGSLVELAVVSNAAMEDRTVLEWDKDDVEALGILKVDVLGLGMLTCLKRCFDLLRQHAHLDVGLRTLPPECPKTYEMLRQADSIGVFQVESRAQMNMLPRLRPEKFYDLVIEVAIVRPGPIAGDMVHPYLRRRAKLEDPDYPSPSLEHGPPNELQQVLDKTLGVPLFQEQAMRIAMVAAGFTADEADQLRRAMATFKMNGKVDRYRDKLVSGMVRRGYKQDFAERLFSQIEGFGDYGFPESHAASFALLVYASAWVKCHHPAVFACALINSQPMGFYAPAQLVRDAREHGVAIRPIDVNASTWDCTLEPEVESANGLALRLGLRMVASLSQEEAEAIVKARDARNGTPFASVEELARRSGVGRRALDALAAADAFAGLGAERRRAAWDARGVSAGPHDLPLFATAADPLADEPPLIAEPAPALVPATEGETVVEDYRATGLTLRRHPMALLRPALMALRCADTRQFHEAGQGSSLRLAGLVLMRQRPGSAKGVIFLTVEDEHGVANLVAYPDVAMRYRAALVSSRLLLAEGRVERVIEHAEVPITHLLIRSLTDRSDLLDGLLQPEEAELEGAARSARMPPSRDFR